VTQHEEPFPDRPRGARGAKTAIGSDDIRRKAAHLVVGAADRGLYSAAAGG
jgi:hypothetical protein